MASQLGGQNFGTGLVEPSGIPENEERILNLNWEMRDGLAKSLAFKAEKKLEWPFNFSGIEIEVIRNAESRKA